MLCLGSSSVENSQKGTMHNYGSFSFATAWRRSRKFVNSLNSQEGIQRQRGWVRLTGIGQLPTCCPLAVFTPVVAFAPEVCTRVMHSLCEKVVLTNQTLGIGPRAFWMLGRSTPKCFTLNFLQQILSRNTSLPYKGKGERSRGQKGEGEGEERMTFESSHFKATASPRFPEDLFQSCIRFSWPWPPLWAQAAEHCYLCHCFMLSSSQDLLTGAGRCKLFSAPNTLLIPYKQIVYIAFASPCLIESDFPWNFFIYSALVWNI